AAVVARDQVVAALEASGELHAQRALLVPEVISRIGLISATTAAGRNDVVAVLARSPLAIQVVDAPAAMAGPRVPFEVAAALSRLDALGVNVIVVARGGGPRSDLAAWDSIELARAIAACPTPVWVALGHASDRTVADMAAHQSHPTPSAAAAARVASAEAMVQRQAQETSSHLYRTQLATARRRFRHAVGVAVVVAIILIAVLWGLAR
ncbi:MAG: exodeoxyribonuclease VII large subunit, partial [Acidimicrobiales bacterium]